MALEITEGSDIYVNLARGKVRTGEEDRAMGVSRCPNDDQVYICMVYA